MLGSGHYDNTRRRTSRSKGCVLDGICNMGYPFIHKLLFNSRSTWFLRWNAYQVLVPLSRPSCISPSLYLPCRFILHPRCRPSPYCSFRITLTNFQLNTPQLVRWYDFIHYSKLRLSGGTESSKSRSRCIWKKTLVNFLIKNIPPGILTFSEIQYALYICNENRGSMRL